MSGIRYVPGSLVFCKLDIMWLLELFETRTYMERLLLSHTKHSQTMATVQEYLLLKLYNITNPPVLSLISLTWEHVHILGQGFLNKKQQ